MARACASAGLNVYCSIGPVFKQQMDEIAAYKNSKLLSSIIILAPLLEIIIERGVNIIFDDGNNKVITCYTAFFLSIASFSDMIFINI
jgi:hypothetical protein